MSVSWETDKRDVDHERESSRQKGEM
jgi:hypothetical protein